MPTPAQYIDRIEFADRFIKMKTEGLTHADSMKQPPFPTNCMNWNVGHLMVFREQYLGALDGMSTPNSAEYAIYGVGSEPLTESDKAIPLNILIERLDATSERLREAFQAMPLEKLNEPYKWWGARQRLDDYLHFYVVVHEALHLGELVILRELALA